MSHALHPFNASTTGDVPAGFPSFLSTDFKRYFTSNNMPLQVRDGRNFYFSENHDWPNIVVTNDGGVSHFPFMSFGYDFKQTIEELRGISLPPHIQVWDALSDASKVLWDPSRCPSYGKPGRAYDSDYSGLVPKPCPMPYDRGGYSDD